MRNVDRSVECEKREERGRKPGSEKELGDRELVAREFQKERVLQGGRPLGQLSHLSVYIYTFIILNKHY